MYLTLSWNTKFELSHYKDKENTYAHYKDKEST
jgi:hypothetical protein